MGELVKQDINFMEYNLWIQDEVLSQKTEGYVWKDREGYIYRAGYKPPSKTDFIFLLSLLMQSQQEGWKDEIVSTRYKILQKCGIQRGKDWYIRLEESLKRWKMVGIEFQGTFYDGKEYRTMNFGIIDDWRLEKETGRLIINFNHLWLIKIKESNFCKYINFEQIKQLKSPLVVRLYEILLKNFQGRDRWEIDALKLALKIPMNEKHVAHIIIKIEAAVRRITKNTDLKIKLTTIRSQRGVALFIFEKISKKEAEKLFPTVELPVDETLKKLMESLPQEYQDKKTVLEIIAKFYKNHGYEYVLNNIRYTNKYSTGNYRAYLQKSLIENWGEIIREEEEAMREAKRREDGEKKKREAEEWEKERQKKEQEKEEELRRDKDIERSKTALEYIKKLSPKDQKVLEEEALRDYISETVKLYGRTPQNRPPDVTIRNFMLRRVLEQLKI